MRPESTWTPPSEFCPRPHHWHAVDSMSTEAEVSEMVGGLVRGLQPELAVEVGCGWGVTTEHLGRAVQRNGHGRVLAIDVVPDFVSAASLRCAGLPVDVRLADAATWDPPVGIDFLFMDGGEVVDRPRYFAHLRPRMRKGSFAVFYDAAPHHGLHVLLDGMRAAGLIERYIVLRSPRGLCVAEVG